ncbi:pep-cterm sorting domain-containing protein [Anaeramoeba ignava]|uniref:Pep-cterm sorting domain-containing protein n=1 Tax=Anaeramoeba ignava TaxID=1746090 RepID=A0A9Q0LI63_ANAIG|nr:pep-cterm sorting domain-containing protein [Anaeramoeba ignava]
MNNALEKEFPDIKVKGNEKEPRVGAFEVTVNEESYFDFEIICEQNQISFKTHKSILSSRSQYFKSLFKSKMKEYQENKMILKDVSSSILFSILNYFYSGRIEINLENAIQILIFSSKYLIDELIEICSNFIKNNFQFETVVDVLKLSESMNFNQLLDFCYQFILDNFEEFIKTSFFLELKENHLNSILSNDEIPINEFEMFQAIIKWGKHESNINQVSKVIDKIRFIDFSKEELEDSLKEDLIPKQISEKLIQFKKIKKDKKELKEFIEKENQDQNGNSFIFRTRFRMEFNTTIIKSIEYVKKLKEWINDGEFFSRMKLGFSAIQDGFDCKKWHSKCDNKGKTLVIIRTEDNFIFGGFTSIGFTNDRSKWRKKDRKDYGGYIIDPKAFIFSLRNDKDDRKPEKFSIQKGEEEFAILYHGNLGPVFGSNQNPFEGPDFALNSNLQSGYSNLGETYNLPNGIEYGTNETQNYLTGSYDKWEVDELETYFI